MAGHSIHHTALPDIVTMVNRDTRVDVGAIEQFDDIIDVRSPGEFAIDHVPGAANFPVLDDEERARVGTLYKQVSPFEARRLGAALIARNIAQHLETGFAARPRDWRPLIYCWRGGQRSGAMATVFRDIGWKAATLEGGYQSWRRAVLADIDALPPCLHFRVICGATGSGKSALLTALADQGAQVLDLEGLARHRGSVLGGLPEAPQPSQKFFDSLLRQQLRRLSPAQPVYVEAESRRIGQVHLPTVLLERMRASPGIRIEAPMPERVKFLLGEYRHHVEQPQRLRQLLQQLAKLQSGEIIARWGHYIDATDWQALVGELLELHYDPLYHRSMGTNYASAGGKSLRLDSLAPGSIADAAAGLLATQQAHAHCA